MSAIANDVLPPRVERPSRKVETSREGGTAFTIQGRSGVLAYHARFLVMLVATVAVGLVGSMMGIVGAVMIGVAVIASMVLMFFATAQRLHDLNHSAWFMLIMLIPLIGALFSIYVVFMPGKHDDNDFGEWRESIGGEKILGYIGLVVMVLTTVGGVVAGFSAPAAV